LQAVNYKLSVYIVCTVQATYPIKYSNKSREQEGSTDILETATHPVCKAVRIRNRMDHRCYLGKEERKGQCWLLPSSAAASSATDPHDERSPPCSPSAANVVRSPAALPNTNSPLGGEPSTLCRRIHAGGGDTRAGLPGCSWYV
jgi:hypothetical protein